MRFRFRGSGFRLGLLGCLVAGVMLTLLVGSSAAAPSCSAGTCTETLFLHGSGGVLQLDEQAPTSSSAKFRDSASVKFAGGNLWKEVGTWSAAAPVAGARTVLSVDQLHAWLGLRNSDDQGTRFDLLAQVYAGGDLVAESLTRCITGLTRNPAKAQETLGAFGAVSDPDIEAGDVITLRLSTRIGTNLDDTRCGGHSNATGLRVYFDATTTGPTRFGLTFRPSLGGPPSIDLALFKDATTPTPLNGIVTYTVRVDNVGGTTATGVQISDPAPAGITYIGVEAPTGVTCDVTSTLFTCSQPGAFAPGASFTVTASATAIQTGLQINFATVSAPGLSDSNPLDNTRSGATQVVAPG